MTPAPAAERAVAAFDFDGTLAPRDSFLPWLRAVCGDLPTAGAMLSAFAGSIRLSGTVDRDAIKAALLSRLLTGREHAELMAHAEAHAARLLSTLRPPIVDHVRKHQAAGDWVVIVSASPELYLSPIGEALGLDGVIGTRLEVGDDGRLTGRMEGLNCRGPEKVARLRSWMADTLPREGATPHLSAYGDSAGDTEMMAIADVATWVGQRARATKRSPTPR